MLSREQDTKVRLTENGAFIRTDSERLKESQRRQAIIEEKRNKQDLKLVGYAIIAVFIAFLIGLAI